VELVLKIRAEIRLQLAHGIDGSPPDPRVRVGEARGYLIHDGLKVRLLLHLLFASFGNL
jgi:hypothetical protein